MTRGQKIAIGFGAALALTGAYFIFIHKPSFKVKSIDWSRKRGIAKLGTKELTFSTNMGSNSVESKGYTLTSEPYGDLVRLNLFKNGNLIESETIDFKSKLRY